MIAAQTHRGPDGEGQVIAEFGRGWIGLGHRRLAIRDLSPAASQPMRHPESGNRLIYNGEIYNHAVLRRDLEGEGVRFRGHGDTEVLLYALVNWGPECLSRLEGMYAFAYHDAREGRVLLARDPLGIKPLYVASARGAFVFASEVRAVLASGLIDTRVDPEALAGLLAWGMPQEPVSMIESVRAFPAGCRQWISFDDVNGESLKKPVRYWRFPDPRPNVRAGEASEEVRETLDAAVRDHLVSDVPVGVFLSSGLDSTIVAGLAARHAADLRTYTVDFPDQPEMSEARIAAATAKRLGSVHRTVRIGDAEALAMAQSWLAGIDQPSLDGINTYVISQAVRREGVIVALSGQGGDELFGGYPSFVDVPRLHRVMRLAGALPRGLRQKIAGLLAITSSQTVREKARDIAATDGSLLALYLQRRRTMSNRQLGALGIPPAHAGNLPAGALEDCAIDQADPVAAVSRLEARLYLGNTLLHVGDTSGMAHGLEIRVPMLDRRLIDLAFALPGKARLPAARADKRLLRTAFADLLPPAVTDHAKRGFVLPLGAWMRGPLRDFCEGTLDYLRRDDVLRGAGVDDVWNAFLREPESPAWSRAWTLCVLGNWLMHTRSPSLQSPRVANA